MILLNQALRNFTSLYCKILISKNLIIEVKYKTVILIMNMCYLKFEWVISFEILLKHFIQYNMKPDNSIVFDGTFVVSSIHGAKIMVRIDTRIRSWCTFVAQNPVPVVLILNKYIFSLLLPWDSKGSLVTDREIMLFTPSHTDLFKLIQLVEFLLTSRCQILNRNVIFVF